MICKLGVVLYIAQFIVSAKLRVQLLLCLLLPLLFDAFVWIVSSSCMPCCAL